MEEPITLRLDRTELSVLHSILWKLLSEKQLGSINRAVAHTVWIRIHEAADRYLIEQEIGEA